MNNRTVSIFGQILVARLSLLAVAAAALVLGTPQAHAQFPPGTLLKVANDTTIPIEDGQCELTSEDASVKTTIVCKDSMIKIKGGAEIFIRRSGGIVANAKFSKGVIEVAENFSVNDVAVHRLTVYRNGSPKVREITIAGKPALSPKYYYDGSNFISLNTPLPIAAISLNKSYFNLRPYLYFFGTFVLLGAAIAVVFIVRRRSRRSPPPPAVTP